MHQTTQKQSVMLSFLDVIFLISLGINRVTKDAQG